MNGRPFDRLRANERSKTRRKRKILLEDHKTTLPNHARLLGWETIPSFAKGAPMNETVANFLHYMTVERGASPNTLAAYRNDLTQLTEYLQSGNGLSNEHIAWEEVTERTISDYVLYLHGLGYSETTRARKIASTKSLFGFLVDDGVLEGNPTTNVSAPRVGRSLPKALSIEEVDRLLAAPGGGSHARGHTRSGDAGTPLRQRHEGERTALPGYGRRVYRGGSGQVFRQGRQGEDRAHSQPGDRGGDILRRGSPPRPAGVEVQYRPVPQPQGKPADTAGILVDSEGLLPKGGSRRGKLPPIH